MAVSQHVQLAAALTQGGVHRAASSALAAQSSREGAASDLIRRVSGTADGAVGGVHNPVQAFASPVSRARARAGFRDDASYGTAVEQAKGVTRRLKTRSDVLGGSQTAERLADDADALDMLGGAAQQTMRNGPLAGAISLGSAAWNGLGRRAVGSELDAASRYLLGGGNGQAPRKDVLAMLARMMPFMERQMVRQTARRGATVGTGARMLTSER